MNAYDRRRVARLICIECGETSEDGEGWKAELAVRLLDEYEFDGEGSDEVAVFCPRCWLREFGDP
jgi:hypothetical protein